MSGGIKITSIEEIRQTWAAIKANLTHLFELKLKRCDEWEITHYEKFIAHCNKLPDNVSNLNNNQIGELFKFLSYCELPYVFEDYLITSHGDNIPEFTGFLDECLHGLSLETWT